MRRTYPVGRVLWVVAACMALGACTTRQAGGVDGTSAVAPTLVVERFLRAANANDLGTMAQLFGTRDGSVLKRDSRAEVEKRMYLMANILKHEDFRFAGEGIVPGRSREATRLLIDVRRMGSNYMVPFTLVRSEKGGWMIEQIELEVITAGRGASW